MKIRDYLLRRCVGHPWVVTGGWLAFAVALMVPLALRLAGPVTIVDNSVGVWFLRDDPGLSRYEQNNDAFGRKEWSLLLLETDSVADVRFLRDLARLTAEIEAQPHVRRVLSLATVRGVAWKEDGTPRVVALLDPSSPQAGDILRGGLARMPAMEHLLLPQGWGTRTAVLVQSDNLLHDRDPYRLALVDAVHRLVDATPTVRSHSFAGTVVINAELNRSARRDAQRFYLLVTGMVLVFGWFALRDFGDLGILALVLAVAVVGPMGTIAACQLPFNMVTILEPLILVSLSVCDVIHVINAFHGERPSLAAPDAARSAIERLWVPCLWTSIVTIVGMLSLAASTVAPIRQMGLFTSLGLALAWACTMTLVPALLAARWKHRSRSAASGWTPGKYGSRLMPFLTGRWRWFWLAVTAVLSVPVLWLSDLRIDTDYTRFFSASAPVSQSYAKLREAGMAQSVVEIAVTADSAAALDGERGRASMCELERRVQLLPQVRHTLSEAQLLAQIDQARGGATNPPRWVSYPEPAVRQIRDMARAAGLTDIDDYATAERTRQRMLALTDYMSSVEMGEFRAAVARIADAHLPAAAHAEVLGTTVLWANMDREIGTTQVRSIVVIAAVFFILLPILFRSFRLGMIGAFINGLPLAMTFGLMGLVGARLNMATALIGGVAIGSTVDSTLFFINRFQKEYAAGRSWTDAIAAAVHGVGDGIVITTAILAGGFLCMTVSSFMPTAHFGLFTCFTIITGAFLDVIIDPILLGFLAPRSQPEIIPASAPVLRET